MFLTTNHIQNVIMYSHTAVFPSNISVIRFLSRDCGR